MSLKNKILNLFNVNEQKFKYPSLDDTVALVRQLGHLPMSHKTSQHGPYTIQLRPTRTDLNISRIERSNPDEKTEKFDPNHRSSGKFKEFVQHVEGLAKQHGFSSVTFGEVQNHSKYGGFLDKTLERYGYTRKIDPFGMDEYNLPSYTKEIK